MGHKLHRQTVPGARVSSVTPRAGKGLTTPRGYLEVVRILYLYLP